MYCAENCACTLCRELCCVKSVRSVDQMAEKNRPPVTVPKPKFVQNIRASNKFNAADNDDEKNKLKFNLILKRRSSDGFDKQNRKSSLSAASKSVLNRVELATPLTKSMSCNEIRKQFESRSNAVMSVAANNDRRTGSKVANGNHKTVIYFGDSISSKKQISWPVQHHRIASAAGARQKNATDVQHANRLCDEMVFKRQQSIRMPAMPPPMKIELRSLKVAAAAASTGPTSISHNDAQSKNAAHESVSKSNLPHFVESVTNGVINIKIEGSYDEASKLVQTIENDSADGGDEVTLSESVRRSRGETNATYYDWSFVQDWRSR